MAALPDAGDAAAAAAAAEAAARRSYGKLVAIMAARSHDVAAAEDALAEAFAEALAHWPRQGVPHNPEAWLLTVARRKRVDEIRRQRQGDATAAHLQWLADLDEAFGAEEAPAIPDRRLGLLFACAHPGIDRAVRAPLMLQVVLGFDAATVASAFLVSPAAMGQRLARAKTKIRQAGIGFEVPELDALPERLDSVLDAIYAAYAEGWSDPQGVDPRRRNLADEAIWLGRLAAALMPDQGEALALLSLMLHTHARRAARRNAAGDYVPLAAQDVAQWDAALIDEAEGLLRQATRTPGLGRFQLEAAVQSAHAVRLRGGQADWAAIAQLYEALCALTDSPVAALNRAVALSHSQGVAAALALLDELGQDARLADYQPYWAARADLLARSGQVTAARQAYQQAVGLESDAAVRQFLQARAAALGPDQASQDRMRS